MKGGHLLQHEGKGKQPPGLAHSLNASIRLQQPAPQPRCRGRPVHPQLPARQPLRDRTAASRLAEGGSAGPEDTEARPVTQHEWRSQDSGGGGLAAKSGLRSPDPERVSRGILISGKTLPDSCLPLFSFYMLVERHLVVLTKNSRVCYK